MVELENMLTNDTPIAEIGDYLDRLDHQSRLQEINGLPREMLAHLYKIAKPGLSVDDLIPKNGKPLQPVIFYGKNSLPAFRTFQKRMCRSETGSELYGYNHQTLGWLTGPGYFVVRDHSDRPGEVMVDYTHVPKKSPPSWPRIKSNKQGVSRLVYASMKDFLRRVSKHVVIGEATKEGKKLGQYFVLCREDS